jgi:hypothetical protein
MKTLRHLLLLLITCLTARAAIQTLPILNGMNYIGAHVIHPPYSPLATASGVSGSTVTFNAGGWVNLVSGQRYEIEHPSNGYWAVVTSWNNATRTVTLSSPWIHGISPTPLLRRVKTLDQLFGGGFNLSQITAGTALTADKIWVPNGSGFHKYFRHTSGIWRRVGGGPASRANTPIHLIQGMIYERVTASPITLNFTGDAVTVQRRFGLNGGTPEAYLTSIDIGSVDLVSSVFELTPGTRKPLNGCGLLPAVSPFTDLVGIQDAALSIIYCYSDGSQFIDANSGNPTGTLQISYGFLYVTPNFGVVAFLTP